MATTRPLDTNQPVLYVPNNDLLNKVMTSPVIYVRQNPKCALCPDTYNVYIHTAVIGDGNFEVLKDLLFRVVDDACCKFSESCSVLKFYSSADDTILYNVAYPGCCEDCCKDCCSCKSEKSKCCDCKCNNCYTYGAPLHASYGDNQSSRFGHYARRFCGDCCCCSYLNSNQWEFFDNSSNSRYYIEMDCSQSFSPCMNLYPLNFHIRSGEQIIGNVIRSPRGCCGTYTFEIQFPTGLSLEDRLLLIAFCCKQN